MLLATSCAGPLRCYERTLDEMLGSPGVGTSLSHRECLESILEDIEKAGARPGPGLRLSLAVRLWDEGKHRQAEEWLATEAEAFPQSLPIVEALRAHLGRAGR